MTFYLLIYVAPFLSGYSGELYCKVTTNSGSTVERNNYGAVGTENKQIMY